MTNPWDEPTEPMGCWWLRVPPQGERRRGEPEPEPPTVETEVDGDEPHPPE